MDHYSVLKNRKCLSRALESAAEDSRVELDRLKSTYKDIHRDDFLWHYLLQSFSTMGRSAGWNGLIGNKANCEQVTYDNLCTLELNERERVVHNVCKAAKVRMPKKKAEFILKCFEQLRQLGGPVDAKAKLLDLPGRKKNPVSYEISWYRQEVYEKYNDGCIS